MPGHFTVRAPGGYSQLSLSEARETFCSREAGRRSGAHDARRVDRLLAPPDLAGEGVALEDGAGVVSEVFDLPGVRRLDLLEELLVRRGR
eukprot:1433161-Alexandrium_andersonii.AAC.1